MKVSWKSASRRLAEQHNDRGSGLVAVCDGPIAGVGLEVLSTNDNPPSIQGRTLTGRAVRQLLWEDRKSVPGKPDEATMIWSIYDNETDRSFVGFGRLLLTESDVRSAQASGRPVKTFVEAAVNHVR